MGKNYLINLEHFKNETGDVSEFEWWRVNVAVTGGWGVGTFGAVPSTLCTIGKILVTRLNSPLCGDLRPGQRVVQALGSFGLSAGLNWLVAVFFRCFRYSVDFP